MLSDAQATSLKSQTVIEAVWAGLTDQPVESHLRQLFWDFAATLSAESVRVP